MIENHKLQTCGSSEIANFEKNKIDQVKKASFVLLVFVSLSCLSQDENELLLEIVDYEKILDVVDTLEGDYNYHIISWGGYSSETRVLNILINDKLGSSILVDGGYSICEFFPYKQGHVFVYEGKKCHRKIPAGYMNDLVASNSSRNSTLLAPNGFEVRVLIEREGDDLLIWSTRLLNAESFKIDENDF